MQLGVLYEPKDGGPDMGRVRESEGTGEGDGRSAVRGVGRAARQKHGKVAGGRGLLLLSGYKNGKPYYLYADGTPPTASKVAACCVGSDGKVARRASGEDTSCWAEERRRLGAEVQAAVTQASIRQQTRGLAGQPTTPSIPTLRMGMAACLARRGVGLEHQEDAGAVAVRLQLEDAIAA